METFLAGWHEIWVSSTVAHITLIVFTPSMLSISFLFNEALDSNMLLLVMILGELFLLVNFFLFFFGRLHQGILLIG